MSKRTSKEDRAAQAVLEAYVQRYEMNRPVGSSPFPGLVQDSMSGTGCGVYNRDGGTTIAKFSTPDAAATAIVLCHRAYAARTGRDWFAA